MNSDVRGLTVLVVDDMATNRQVLQIFLTKLGCQVLTANDGQQAVDICRSSNPDIVLMDVMMPVMDGHEAARRIKAEQTGRWLPVVFLSALDKEEDLVAGLEAGGDDYLAKPINLVVLNAKLRSLARTIRAQRSLDEARQWNQAVSDSIDDCIITIDESSVIQSVNSAVSRLFGYQADELIGSNVKILMPELVRERHDDYVASYIARPEPKLLGNGHRQVEGLTRTGQTIMLEAGITEMHQQGRRLFVGILRDITARIAAEETLRRHAAELQRYHDDREAESALAGEILARLLQRPGLKDPRIAYWLEAATYFSGDIVAACVSPEGKLYALLADGTGHGLAAAISQLPVLAAFYGLAEHDYPLGFIAYQVNRQLLSFMPVGRFVAATMVCVDAEGRTALVWSGGMPELLLVAADGSVRSGLAHTNLPLGIAEFDDETAHVSVIDCPPGSQLVMVSDGLTDALNGHSEAFGKDRLIAILSATPAADRVQAVRAAVREHCGAASATDDISIMVIDCRAPAL